LYAGGDENHDINFHRPYVMMMMMITNLRWCGKPPRLLTFTCKHVVPKDGDSRLGNMGISWWYELASWRNQGFLTLAPYVTAYMYTKPWTNTL
jgi:hypothetical protein